MSNYKKIVEKLGDGQTELDGWCRIGSYVSSNYHAEDADIKQRITEIHTWPSCDWDANVSTDGANGANTLTKVSFRSWIKNPNRKP